MFDLPSQKKTHVTAKLGSNSATCLPLSELRRTQDVPEAHAALRSGSGTFHRGKDALKLQTSIAV